MLAVTPAAVPLRLQSPAGELLAAFAHIGAEAFADVEAAATAVLHPRELEVLAGLRAERRRRSFLLGRHAAKAALAHLGSFEPTSVEIANGALEQPVVRWPRRDPVDVSISHTDARACALAFPAQAPMGLDVEERDAKRAATMESQLSARELALAHAVTGDVLAAATLGWTVREALSKALRCGLTVPAAILEIETLVAGPQGIEGRFRNFAQYTLHAWVRPACVVALVVPMRCRLLAGPGFPPGPEGAP